MAQAMTRDQVTLVKETFALLVPYGDLFGARFYDELFGLNPNIQYMFRGDRKVQERKLTEMIAATVADLSRPEVNLPRLAQLGARHVAYGAKDADFGNYRRAFMRTLEQFIAERFTAEVKAAWAEFFEYIINIMKRGMAERRRVS